MNHLFNNIYNVIIIAAIIIIGRGTQITTGQLTSALNRANQRSGSTVVPVY